MLVNLFTVADWDRVDNGYLYNYKLLSYLNAGTGYDCAGQKTEMALFNPTTACLS